MLHHCRYPPPKHESDRHEAYQALLALATQEFFGQKTAVKAVALPPPMIKVLFDPPACGLVPSTSMPTALTSTCEGGGAGDAAAKAKAADAAATAKLAECWALWNGGASAIASGGSGSGSAGAGAGAGGNTKPGVRTGGFGVRKKASSTKKKFKVGVNVTGTVHVMFEGI